MGCSLESFPSRSCFASSSIKSRCSDGEFHIVLVDNGRSEWVADPDHWEALKCIRCGSCMNTCPVYRRSGGYSYSYFIPGPIGINLGMLRNPDAVPDAQSLNGTGLGIIRGDFGVAENGCIWVPQAMKERAVCFISEHLVILLPKGCIVNNMHEAYRQIGFSDYGYGTFISGPSKTADIAQVLVMGAQASRSVTVILL